MYLLRSGTTMVAARLDGKYTAFPGDPDMLNIMPLGARSEPVAEYGHFAIAPDDMFIMGDAGVAVLSDTVLEIILNAGDVEQVLEKLESTIERQANATVIQFIDPDMPVPDAVNETEAAETKTTETAKVETVTVTTGPTEVEKASETPSPAAETAAPAIASTEAGKIATPAPAAPPEAIDQGDASSPAQPEDKAEEKAAPPDSPDAPTASEESAQKPTSDEEKTTTTESAKPAGDAQPVKTTTTTSTKKASFFQAIIGGIILFVSSILASIARYAGLLLNRILPEPEKEAGSETIPVNVAALIAVVVPAVIGIVAVGLILSGADDTSFEQLRDEALASLEDARQAKSSGDETAACELWDIARTDVLRALNEFQRDEALQRGLEEARNELNFCDRVQRVEIARLREFKSNADLRGPILDPSGTTLYTLDRNRGEVYRDDLGVDYSGQPAIVEQGEQPILSHTDRVSGERVYNIVDIEWMTNGGAARNNALIALGENGLLVSYLPTTGPQAIQLETPPGWKEPIAIATWRQNFYVLDRGASQIWRFVPTNGFYENQGEEYFSAGSRPDLSRAVDFGIDSQDGAIYILFDDGNIQKFLGGEPARFDFAGEPYDGLGSGYALFVNNNPAAYALYLADRSKRALYQISFGGNINGGFRPVDDRAFADISGVFVDSSFGVDDVYVLSGNSLYYFVP
jgi:hypothetical protein